MKSLFLRKTIKPIEELTFTDDFMSDYVMRNEEISKELLERLLKIKIERLEYPELQKSISPYCEAKGVRLDVYVKDSDKVFDIENPKWEANKSWKAGSLLPVNDFGSTIF